MLFKVKVLFLCFFYQYLSIYLAYTHHLTKPDKLERHMFVIFLSSSQL